MLQAHDLEFLSVRGLRWQLSFVPSRTEPAAGKETGAAKVSKNLELARLIPASSSARELGPVGLQGGPGGPGDPALGIEGDRGGRGALPHEICVRLPSSLSAGLPLSLGLPTLVVGVHTLSLPTSPRLMDEVGSGSSGTPTPSPASSPPSPAQADAAGEAEAEDAEGTEQAVYVPPSVPRFFQAPLPSSLALGRSGNTRRSAAPALGLRRQALWRSEHGFHTEVGTLLGPRQSP